MRVTRQGRRAWEVVASHTRAAQRQLKKELAVEPAHGSKAGARGRGDAPSCSSSLSGRADASPRAASVAMAAPREAGVKASERRSHGEELAFETALEAACRSTDSVGRPLPGRWKLRVTPWKGEGRDVSSTAQRAIERGPSRVAAARERRRQPDRRMQSRRWSSGSSASDPARLSIDLSSPHVERQGTDPEGYLKVAVRVRPLSALPFA